jgi:hypothetical protein
LGKGVEAISKCDIDFDHLMDCLSKAAVHACMNVNIE